MSTPVQFTVGLLPSGYCLSTLQQFLNDVFGGIVTGSVSVNGVVVGPGTPAASNQGQPWLKLDAFNNPIGWFYYNQGYWIWPHPVPPSDLRRIIYTGPEDGSATGVWTLDGGDGNDPSIHAPTEISGAMWQVDHNFDFMVPMGAGTNTVAYNGAALTALALNATTGEEKHTLTFDEMWHQHGLGKLQDGDLSARAMGFALGGSLNTISGHRMSGYQIVPGQDGADVADLKNFHFPAGSGTIHEQVMQTDLPIPASSLVNSVNASCGYDASAHGNLQPSRGVFFLKRTARVYMIGA